MRICRKRLKAHYGNVKGALRGSGKEIRLYPEGPKQDVSFKKEEKKRLDIKRCNKSSPVITGNKKHTDGVTLYLKTTLREGPPLASRLFKKFPLSEFIFSKPQSDIIDNPYPIENGNGIGELAEIKGRKAKNGNRQTYRLLISFRSLSIPKYDLRSYGSGLNRRQPAKWSNI
ncbi:hypothetical protein GWI33_015638 [Rhynchophorus ferrugineus]|uniref:Uncharacterized protein n=1 Tax=Rhynchophorus ferrugineus TaxID=354439 RepID=A0A834M5S3_RHYFE|nr:hypothetical protein GWI33_015638 [Rhynchophorus ferrugineus]